MQLSAGCELVLDVSEESPLVTMLRPQRGPHVIADRFVVSAPVPVTQYSDTFRNLCQRFTAPPGELRIRTATRVEVEPEVAVNCHAPRTSVAKLPHATLQFTLPSRYCPSDKLTARAKQLVAPSLSGYDQVRAISDHVHEGLAYRYGVSNASTDAEETLSQGAGVCRDFAHVAIALCRAIDIPARMVAGYLHGREPMDLHAWFEAYVGDRWYTFDPTEPNLRGGRIVLAHGRDAADIAFLTDFGSAQLRSMKVWVDELAAAERFEPSSALRAVG